MTSGTIRAIVAQTRMELALTARRGENVLVTIVIPLVLLVFFASSGRAPGTGNAALDYLVPGILTLAIVSTGMVNLGISTAYERYYGVLKRLGGSPLPRAGLMVAKALTMLALEIVQLILLVGVAIVGFGWTPHVNVGLALLLTLVGSLTFCFLGLAMAGGLRAEATLALANGLYLGFLLLGDVLLPASQLPGFLQPVSAVLPVTALSDLLRAAFSTSVDLSIASMLSLAAWTIGAGFVAIRAFRWE